MKLARHEYSCGKHEYELTTEDGHSCLLSPTQLTCLKLFRQAVKYKLPRHAAARLYNLSPREWADTLSALQPGVRVVIHEEPLLRRAKPAIRRRLQQLSKITRPGGLPPANTSCTNRT